MLSLKTLWRQRLKWQVGTAQDLKKIGFNRQTMIDWYQQALGVLAAWMRVAWLLLLVFDVVAFHHIYLFRFWWVFPLLFVVLDVETRCAFPPHQGRRAHGHTPAAAGNIRLDQGGLVQLVLGASSHRSQPRSLGRTDSRRRGGELCTVTARSRAPAQPRLPLARAWPSPEPMSLGWWCWEWASSSLACRCSA